MHLNKNSILLIPAITLGVLVACSPEEKSKSNVVAQVNLAQMTTQELAIAVPPSVSTEVGSALKRKLIEKWIEDEIFYQSALKEGLSLNENEKRMVENYQRSLLVDKYLDKYISTNYKPLEQEIENYYNLHRQEFVWKEESVHLVHLVLDTDDRTLKE
jgi:hypothetical protein